MQGGNQENLEESKRPQLVRTASSWSRERDDHTEWRLDTQRFYISLLCPTFEDWGTPDFNQLSGEWSFPVLLQGQMVVISFQKFKPHRYLCLICLFEDFLQHPPEVFCLLAAAALGGSATCKPSLWETVEEIWQNHLLLGRNFWCMFRWFLRGCRLDLTRFAEGWSGESRASASLLDNSFTDHASFSSLQVSCHQYLRNSWTPFGVAIARTSMKITWTEVLLSTMV